MHRGEVFVLNQDVFIWQVNSDDDYPRRLVPPGGGDKLEGNSAAAPASVESWLKNPRPSDYPGVRGIVHKGCVLSLERIVYVDHLDVAFLVYEFKVIDGDCRGQTFCLTDLMIEDQAGHCQMPDPQYLRSVS